MSKEMKRLIVENGEFEVVDDNARGRLTNAESRLTTAESRLSDIPNENLLFNGDLGLINIFPTAHNLPSDGWDLTGVRGDGAGLGYALMSGWTPILRTPYWSGMNVHGKRFNYPLTVSVQYYEDDYNTLKTASCVIQSASDTSSKVLFAISDDVDFILNNPFYLDSTSTDFPSGVSMTRMEFTTSDVMPDDKLIAIRQVKIEEGDTATPIVNSGKDGAAIAMMQKIGEETYNRMIVSPAFTGTPTAPTQAAGNNSTRIATTAFVNEEIAKDTEYHVGDSVLISGMLCPFLQQGSTARIFIPLSKPIGSDVSNSGISQTGNFEIRMNGVSAKTGHPLSYYGTVAFSKTAGGIGAVITLNSNWDDLTRYSTGLAYVNANNTITFS